MCTLTEKPGAESSVTKKFMDSCSVSEMPVAEAEAESSVAVKPRMAVYSGDKMTADTAQSDGGSSSDPQAGSYYAAHSGSGYDDPKAGVRTAYEGSAAGVTASEGSAAGVTAYEGSAAGVTAYEGSGTGRTAYEAPDGTADYEAPTGSTDYEAPAGSKDYEAPAGSADYEAPAGKADYEAPAGSADYEIPALDSDYNIGDLVEDTKISADRGSSKIS